MKFNSNSKFLFFDYEDAEQTLREVGMAVLWEDLPEEDRHSMLIQLCRNSELLGNSGIQYVTFKTYFFT